MSDGSSDAHAICELHNELESAAFDLRDAIKKAIEGHRGWSVNVESIVNETLEGSGFKLVKTR